jgi:hypothetical protein
VSIIAPIPAGVQQSALDAALAASLSAATDARLADTAAGREAAFAREFHAWADAMELAAAEEEAAGGTAYDDAPAELVDVDPVSAEDRRWWGWAAPDRDGPTDEDYDAMIDAWGEGEGRAFPDDYAGLTDADCCPGGIG